MRARARSVATPLALAAALGAGACALHRVPPPEGSKERGVALYRVTFDDPDLGTRRFKALLFAALPDRLRVEVLSPIGGPEVILDSGAGRLSVVLVSERTGYVGEASADAMREVVGLPVSAGTLVRAILLGEQPSGAEVSVDRSGSRAGFPPRCEIRSGGFRLLLERRGFRPNAPLDPRAATGGVPPGIEARPLEELASRLPSRWPAAAGGGGE